MLVKANAASSVATLIRIHAYEVRPQRLQKSPQPAAGGRVDAPQDFLFSLEDYRRRAKLEKRPRVGFQPRLAGPGEYNDNEVRQTVLAFCFGNGPEVEVAAEVLANRLGKSMDARSSSCLLVLTVYHDHPTRTFIGWAFPKDDPYGFDLQDSAPSIHLIGNAFSRSSHFRKAVQFQGLDHPEHFWQGYVMDRQSKLADYWVQDFLDCRMLLDDQQGTRLLADTLKQTHAELDDQAAQQQVAAAIMAARIAQRKSWSLKRFATEYLSGESKSLFLKKAPPEVLDSEFQLDKPLLQSRAGWQLYQLENQIAVLAPADHDEKSLKVTGTRQRYLKCEGWVVAESMAASANWR